MLHFFSSPGKIKIQSYALPVLWFKKKTIYLTIIWQWYSGATALAMAWVSCVCPAADIFNPSTPLSQLFFRDRVDFHGELHEEMSHPLGHTITAEQSLTVCFFYYIVVCNFFFFLEFALATVHVMIDCSLLTSQTLSWGGALSPVWQRADDPTPSPRQAGGSLAEFWQDLPEPHPAKEEAG